MDIPGNGRDGNVAEPVRERAVAAPPWDDDAALAALASRRRREVLSRLIEAGGGLSLVELADGLSSRDGDVSTCRALYLELYHTHVPVLESAGLVEWDRDEGSLTATGRTDRIGEHLE